MEVDISKCETASQAVTTICYNDSTRCLDFRIQCRDVEDLKKCVEIIESYNDFDWKRINEALNRYATIKRFEEERDYNPDFFTFEIGREGSPVMYIKYMRAMSIIVNGTLKQTTVRDVTKEDFEMRMRALAEIAQPDELHFSEDGMYNICRMWWD